MPKPSASYFCNRDCEYFPCHAGADGEDFNCLFCYCPLYPLGESCGGDYSNTAEGIKDCSRCLYPHKSEHYESIVARFGDIVQRMRRADADSPADGREK